MPLISVIVPTLNEEKYLPLVFRGLKEQTFDDFEVIVADTMSKDKTREIARRNGAKVVLVKKPGISPGRNAGARAASGKILVFLDADTMPSKELLEVYSNAFSKDTIAATGPIYALEKTSFAVRLGYVFVSEVFVKLSIALGMPSVVGSNFAVTKKAFDKVKGFNEHLKTYEDWDLSTRLKEQGGIRFIEQASVYASIRRVKAWGIWGYFSYHVGNMFRYTFFRRSKDDYAPIR